MKGVATPTDVEGLTELLGRAGFVAADEEATELFDGAAGDRARLDSMVARRLTGEPLAWITGHALFCDLVIGVHPGVYVPRWQSEALARRATERLPPTGVAVDLCTGTGAVAATLMAARGHARIVASDVDPRAVANAAANGVEVYLGDLFAPLPPALRRQVDVVVGVVPYVPTPALRLLAHDTLTFESPLSYDGGPDGADLLRRALADSARFLRPGGALLLELGGDQADLLAGDLATNGYREVTVLRDDEGDVRGVEATLGKGAD